MYVLIKSYLQYEDSKINVSVKNHIFMYMYVCFKDILRLYNLT